MRNAPGVRVRPSMVFKGKMHFRGSSQLLSQKKCCSYQTSLSQTLIWLFVRKKNERKTKNIACCLFNNKNKENQEKLVEKKNFLSERIHQYYQMPSAKRTIKSLFFYFLIVWCQKTTNIFLAHETPQQSNFFLLSLAWKRLKKRFKRQPFRAKSNPVAFKTKLFSMERS